MENNTNKIVSAIIVVGFLIAGAILLKDSRPLTNTDKSTESAVEVLNIKMKEVSKDDHILGNPNAKIKIVEYSDTGCPFCRIFHETMHKVINESDGNVAWVYRHYPIAGLHPNAFNEALATECSWEQGGNEAFWTFTDQIYAQTQSNNTFTNEDLSNIAKSMNLDMDSYNTCLSTQKYKDKVESHIIDGQIAGVKGTPNSFILQDGEIVDTIAGAMPYEGVIEKINSLK